MNKHIVVKVCPSSELNHEGNIPKKMIEHFKNEIVKKLGSNNIDKIKFSLGEIFDSSRTFLIGKKLSGELLTKETISE